MKTGGSLAQGLVVAALLPLALAAGPATSQPPAASGAQAETLAQLLTEVRHLRQTVDQAAVVGIRVQIVLQRLSSQEQHVRGLSDQAGQLESNAADTSTGVERMKDELGQVEERLDQERDPNTRQALVDQRTTLKDSIERDVAQELDLRRRAAEASQALALERNKLDDLTQALDELERSLALPGTRRSGNR